MFKKKKVKPVESWAQTGRVSNIDPVYFDAESRTHQMLQSSHLTGITACKLTRNRREKINKLEITDSAYIKQNKYYNVRFNSVKTTITIIVSWN